MSEKKVNDPVDFVCIGAQKAGTTWLFSRLRELSEFSLPPVKELHYFDRSKEYPSPNRLSETYLSTRLKSFSWTQNAVKSLLKQILRRDFKKFKWLYKWYFSNFNDSWYLSLFESFEGITGEISPSYAILKEADVKKMSDLIPNAKIIFLIRNPIERAWSQYRFYLGKRNSTLSSNTNDIKELIDFLNTEGQELRSNYIRTIELYKKYYPSNQILIGFFDAIIEQPANLLSDIVNFLGGNTSKISEECNLQEKNKVSIKMELPAEVEKFLKDKYAPMITELSETYGSYCTAWYNDLNNINDASGNKKILAPTIKASSVVKVHE